jgi:hypothetical protein
MIADFREENGKTLSFTWSSLLEEVASWYFPITAKGFPE